MTNIQKVAQQANVSVATVSRVLNNSDKVSENTRSKVEEAIKELNYVPNMLARNFRTAESKSILVMVTSISNFFYMETVHGISQYAYEQGYDILLCETKEHIKRQIDALEKVKNHIADGAIIIESTINDKLLLELEKNNPVVQCAVYSDDSPIPYVSVDNVKGGYIGAKYLVEKGHRKIAFVGTTDKAKYNAERIEGFLKGVKEEGIEQQMDLVCYSNLGLDGGSKIALELIERKDRPTAIFFASDMQAIGAIHALTEHGYCVPQDMAVLGFDNIELCDIIMPGLTTVAQPMREIGREAARLVIERIHNHDNRNRNVVFQPQIVERGSV